MRLNQISLFVSALALTTTCLAQTKPASADVVTGTGCVRAGVTVGCLMVEDTKTGKSINGLFGSKKPALETMIEYTGTKHTGVTTCMQGPAVTITNWEALKMMCPKPKEKEKKK